MAINVLDLWIFSQPAETEQRFREAQAGAAEEDWLILETQIARTIGLRGDFAREREVLEAIRDRVQSYPEALVRWHLELGRALDSVAHRPEDKSEENTARAREHYQTAFELAKRARLDYLAIDALHMMVVVDSAPEDQLKWNMAATEYMEQSDQPDAKRWEGSLRNNTGYALNLAGRYEEAAIQFQKGLELRLAQGDDVRARIARYMIAWNLRCMGRIDEALTMQLELEKDCEAAGDPDPYVFQELVKLYEAKGDERNAEVYRQKPQP